MLYKAPNSPGKKFEAKVDALTGRTNAVQTNVTPPVTIVQNPIITNVMHWTDGLAIVGWLRCPQTGDKILMNNGMVLYPGDGILENYDERKRCILIDGRVIRWQVKKVYEDKHDGRNRDWLGRSVGGVGVPPGQY